MKRYVIIAGANGVGKSTLYQSRLMDLPDERVNLDEIVREIGNWNNVKDTSRAGMIAVRRIKQCFDDGISFNQETTLCGHSILRNITKAKNLGYHITLHYVGVDNVDIAKARVLLRVLSGGHGIPEADIERRFDESKKQAKKILDLCDEVMIYDNTSYLQLVAEMKSSTITYHSSYVPEWVDEILES